MYEKIVITDSDELLYRLQHGVAHGMDPLSMLLGAVEDGMDPREALRLARELGRRESVKG